MNSTLKNLFIILGLLTIGYAAYYVYSARQEMTTNDTLSDAQFEAMLNSTQVFIERRQSLNEMELDVNFLNDERLRNLEANQAGRIEVTAGRNNPFAETGNN
jgi:hypothetical protein